MFFKNTWCGLIHDIFANNNDSKDFTYQNCSISDLHSGCYYFPLFSFFLNSFIIVVKVTWYFIINFLLFFPCFSWLGEHCCPVMDPAIEQTLTKGSKTAFTPLYCRYCRYDMKGMRLENQKLNTNISFSN